jgi:rubrerythrin
MDTAFISRDDLGAAFVALLEFEYDAVSAYRAAVLRIDDQQARLAFEGFQADHERHVRDIGALVRQAGVQLPDAGDIRQMLTVGKIVIGNLAGNAGIIAAMGSNERETNALFENALRRGDLTPAQRAVLMRALDDERRHLNWITARLPH